MHLPFSEPVPLWPDAAARIDRVLYDAQAPALEPFLHFHGPAELVLIEHGCGTFLCDDRTFAFGPGMLVYAPPMTVHDFAFDPGVRAWTLIQFDPHAVDPTAVPLPATPQAIAPDPPARARIAMLADWLATSIAGQAPQTAVVVQLQALMLAVGENADRASGVTTAAPALARFRPLLDQMAREPAETLRLAQAASLCAMSPPYFSRCFTRTFGLGFAAWQTRLKLQQAARHLATGDEPVSQIAWRMGFASHAYFSHCFRAQFGVAPGQHRLLRQARQ